MRGEKTVKWDFNWGHRMILAEDVQPAVAGERVRLLDYDGTLQQWVYLDHMTTSPSGRGAWIWTPVGPVEYLDAPVEPPQGDAL